MVFQIKWRWGNEAVKFSEAQATYALRQAESGTPVADVCRQIGMSESTFYIRKKKYAGLGIAELREIGLPPTEE